MNTVASFLRGEDAYLFRAYLDSEGIEAHVFDEYIPQLFWHYTQAIGGVRVVVADEDHEPATNLFHEYSERLSQEPALVEQVRAWPLIALVSLAVGYPLMLFGKKAISSKRINP